MEIEFNGMGFSYGDVEILRNISFKLNEPELVCIIGPNGVGKSTLMRCINKLLRPTSGNILINGRDVNDYTLREMAEVMAYVPVASSDAQPMSVTDCILMGRHPHSKFGKVSDSDLIMVHNIMCAMDLEYLANRNCNELSAGQYQKVLLARGLIQETEFILLDEPTANLDVRHQMNVTEMLRNLAHEHGKMVLMICHDLNIAAKYADKVIVLALPGMVYNVGTPRDTIDEEMILNVYGVDGTLTSFEERPLMMISRSLTEKKYAELREIYCEDCFRR